MTDPDKKTVPARLTGMAHFLGAAAYSVSGLIRLWKEAAFRHEVFAGAIGLALVVYFAESVAEILGFIILWLIVAATEALNTAIEVLVDHLSPEWAEFAKAAKDLGSLAAAFMISATTLYTAWVVLL